MRFIFVYPPACSSFKLESNALFEDHHPMAVDGGDGEFGAAIHMLEFEGGLLGGEIDAGGFLGEADEYLNGWIPG